MKFFGLILSVLFSMPALAQNAQGKAADFYITGFETLKTDTKATGSTRFPVYEMIYDGEVTMAGAKVDNQKKTKVRSVKAAPVTAEENTDGLRKTLESFQKAISGLCISHLELALAFNVSAKAWMIVTGEVDGSVKVILKNPDEKCPKSGS